MSHKTGLIVLNLAASVAAFGITSGLISAKDAAIASLFAVPSALAAHIIGDSKLQKQINESDERLRKLGIELDVANRNVIKLSEIDSQTRTLLSELNNTREALDFATEQHQKAYDLSSHLQQALTALEGQETTSKALIESLQDEVEEWESEFSNRVATESDRLFQIARKTEIDRIFAEHDKITSEAMSITEAFQKWGMKVSQRFQDKNAAIEDTKAAYQQNIREFTTLVTKERDCYLDQIDLLNQRIAQLQHELAGDLVEPEYLKVAYSIEGRIANDIAREVFNSLQIPLAVKGYHSKPDGSTEVAYGYSRHMGSTALVESLKRQSDDIAKVLRIHKITAIKKLEIADLVVITFRREPAVKDDSVKLLVGSSEEFLNYIVNHPIRYRLIADPGTGKTPTTAVMLSAILKAGCHRGNTAKGAKVHHTLVSVSYPGVQSSLKDADYPLEQFLEYGTESSAVKSFQDAVEDWEFRKQNVKFAEQFFQIRIWDELDNTLNSASEPQTVADNLKKVLKQGGHSNIGWIVSGQSVMTKQLPGFTNDDRSLFTEIIIGIPKIRLYLNTYGKGKNSDSNLAKLTRNLDEIEEYIDSKNNVVTDDARLLRVALVVDSRSPKLYFLPNLDSINFDADAISNSGKIASQIKGKVASPSSPVKIVQMDSESQDVDTASIPLSSVKGPKTPIEGSVHCPECGSSNVSLLSDARYRCKDCKVKRSPNKMVWRQ